MKDLGNQFVRVRLARIDGIDLNLFDFDYDLTLAVFFLNADEQIYARYGGRDADSADAQMSLAGLRHTMKLVLDAHRQAKPIFAQRRNKTPLYPRQLSKYRKSSGCIHCHEVKEMIYGREKEAGRWKRELVWRYPLPENLGLSLDVDRGNVVQKVKSNSPADQTGLQIGDVVLQINNIPIRSTADARYALDRAPVSGKIRTSWKRNGKTYHRELELRNDWRKTDNSWRPSVWRLVPRLFLFGKDLTDAEKKRHGLSSRQTAFRQEAPVSAQARSAGIRAGDVILGVDDKKLELDFRAFLDHVRLHYLLGDRITINVLRDGKRLRFPLTLQ